MLVSDLERFVSLEQLSVSSTGRAALVTSQMDLEEDRYRRRVVIIDEDGSIRPLTHGPFDSLPRWSPDGSRLAFLRQPDRDSKPQVAVMAVDGGEAVAVTEFSLGASDLRWSPDGSMLVVVGTSWLEDLDDEERERKPRRITTLPYRADSAGWIHDRRSRLCMVDPNALSAPEPLTPDDEDASRPVWSPDGRTVAFLSDRTGRKVRSHATEIWEIVLADGTLVRKAGLGYWTALAYRPDGVLHAVGIDDFWDWPTPLGLWRCEDSGWRNLIGHLDRTVSPSLTEVGWIDRDALVVIDDRGSSRIIRIEPDGTVQEVTGRDQVVTGCGVAPETGVVTYTATSVRDPGEVHRLEIESGSVETATDFNGRFRTDAGLVDAHHFEVTSDGVEIDGWVYLPDGSDAVPVLVNIHGGPAAQYGVGFFDEFQIYAGAGFGVVACNPRGSSGRGADFLKAVTGDGWGVVDRADVTSVVEAALARSPRLDPERMGVMGGSYGGFLTAWIAAHDARYRSAIVERALLSWPSFAGTSDIGATFPDQYLSSTVPDGSSVLWAKSPLAVADRISTPTLIIHSEQDHRCPISQAEEFFAVLLKAGTEAEFMRFPGESHELTRSGKPRHRQERFEAIIEWHLRRLGDTTPDLAN